MYLRKTLDLSQARAALIGAGQTAIGMLAVRASERIFDAAPQDTGFLKSMIGYDIQPGSDTAQVYCAVDYSVPVEFGHVTVAGGYVPPNPFFRTGLAQAAADWPDIAASVTLTSQFG